MSKLSNDAVAVAITQIGQQEHPIGSNWGHPVQDYLASVGIHFDASWCMAFVYWCFERAAEHSYIGNPLRKTGGVMDAWNNAGVRRVFDPQPGDIMIIDEGHGLGHTGIVESADPTVVHTIEGNTNDTGSREGYEVIRRIRLRKNIKGYIRY